MCNRGQTRCGLWAWRPTVETCRRRPRHASSTRRTWPPSAASPRASVRRSPPATPPHACRRAPTGTPPTCCGTSPACSGSGPGSSPHDPLRRPQSPSEPPRPPTYDAMLAAFAEHSAALVDALAAADPAEPAWHWAPTQTVGTSYRRQAHEALIHRLDAEQTAGLVTPLDAELAADGVLEALDVMYGGDAPDWGRIEAGPHHVRIDLTDLDRSIWTRPGMFFGTEPESGRSYDGPHVQVVSEPGGRPGGRRRRHRRRPGRLAVAAPGRLRRDGHRRPGGLRRPACGDRPAAGLSGPAGLRDGPAGRRSAPVSAPEGDR